MKKVLLALLAVTIACLASGCVVVPLGSKARAKPVGVVPAPRPGPGPVVVVPKRVELIGVE